MKRILTFIFAISSISSLVAMGDRDDFYVLSADERQQRLIQEKQNKKSREEYEQQQRDAHAARAAEALLEFKKKQDLFNGTLSAFKARIQNFEEILPSYLRKNLSFVEYQEMAWEDHWPSLISVTATAVHTAKTKKKLLLARRMNEFYTAENPALYEKEIAKAITDQEVATANNVVINEYKLEYLTSRR